MLHPDHLRERLRIDRAAQEPRHSSARWRRRSTPSIRRRSACATNTWATPSACGRYITDTAHLLHNGLKSGKRILFEAAQGSLLDVDHGTYPYVTSSNSSPSGIWSGSGVPARHLTRIIGVIKAYTTRVGRGPFPTELDDGPNGIGERIRKTGREYGTVTGRPRRVGWFDAVAARYTAMLAGADEVTVMLLDVLSGLDEFKICTAYELDGERLDDVSPAMRSCWTSASRCTRRCRAGQRVDGNSPRSRLAGGGAAICRSDRGTVGVAGVGRVGRAGSGARSHSSTMTIVDSGALAATLRKLPGV